MAHHSVRRALLGLIGVAALAVLAAIAAAGPRGIPVPSIEKQWSIGLYGGPTPLALEPDAANPVFTARDVSDIRARFVADPFLMRDGGLWHLFFEAFNADTGQGDIAWATSEDLHQWTYRHVVLDEPFHLSYPYVFHAGNSYYMVPETSERRSVRLYRAQPFPNRWVYVRDLVSGVTLVDPSIFFYDGRWWIFAGTAGYALNVYHARDLEGPWIPHSANPVLAGAPDHARPGGRLLTWQGRVYRFAQDDTATYGGSVRAYEITTLTPDRYSERPAGAVFGASGSGWNAAGMHQVDATQIAPDAWIAAVDGAQRTLMFGVRRLQVWPARGAR